MSSNDAKNYYIFLCSNLTECECFDKMLFGGGEDYRKKVPFVNPSDILYLYNIKSGYLFGKYIAISEAKMNIVPEAWEGDFPWQVRVKPIASYIPLHRTDFEKYIQFYRGKPRAKLTKAQYESLESLFQSTHRLTPDENDYRRENPATLPTNDGHWVRSDPEQQIDNWLFSHRIAHGYELPLEEGYCDFIIPLESGEMIYIEYWGKEDKKYIKRKERKLRSYERNKLKLINLTKRDLLKLDEIFSKELLILL